jgi:putative transposase
MERRNSMTIKAHKIRLNPTSEQEKYFWRAAGTRRFAFNWGRAEWQRQLEAGEHPSAMKLKEQFNAIRREQFPWTYDVTKCAIEGAFFDLGDAFTRFFTGRKSGRKVGFPKFKSKKRTRPSFYLSNDKFRMGAHWVQVPVLGDFIVTQREAQKIPISHHTKLKQQLGRVNMAESLRFRGKILGATIGRTGGYWFISIQVEMMQTMPENTNPAVGIDVGINRLATLSDGRAAENQRPLRQKLTKVAHLSRELARRTPGSQNWHKTKLKLTRLHYHIACVREDILHKLTTDIAQRYGVVGIEDLHVKGLFKNHCLAQALSDVSLGRLLKLLEGKVPAQGGTVVKVGRFFPSSQLCHQCGTRKTDLTLSDRIFHCPNATCGYVGDRDLNAAMNILAEAKRLAGVA